MNKGRPRILSFDTFISPSTPMVEVVPTSAIEFGQHITGTVMIGDMLDALKDDEALHLTVPRVAFQPGHVGEARRFRAWLITYLGRHTKRLPYRASVRMTVYGRVAVFKVPR